MNGTVSDVRTCEPLGSDRLLGISDVAKYLGCCPITASKVITESGRRIVLHSRVYILQSSLMAYLQELEAEAC